MLDPAYIRDNPDDVRRAIEGKGDKADLDRWLELDERRREIIQEVQPMRAESNRSGEEIGRLKREGKDEEADALIEEMTELKERIQELDAELKHVEGERDEIALWIPNVPDDDVPPGDTEEDNDLLRTWGEVEPAPEGALEHTDLYETLDVVDTECGGKITGSSFVLYKGPGARLQRALINYMLDTHTGEHGYTEMWPPFLANRDSMVGTGQIPKLEDDMYRTVRDSFYPIPTAEVPLTNIHRGEILDESELPKRYTAYTPCFRREAGSYGADTVGLMRVHQFEKVELVRIVRPESSEAEHESLLEDAERILRDLGLAYRVVLLCQGDLGFAAARCYDLEVWAPASERWFEVSSVSNFKDFQARRADLRYRREADGNVRHVHTLNGSGLALPRVILALLETYQEEDGSVTLPEVLHPYLGGATRISPGE